MSNKEKNNINRKKTGNKLTPYIQAIDFGSNIHITDSHITINYEIIMDILLTKILFLDFMNYLYCTYRLVLGVPKN